MLTKPLLLAAATTAATFALPSDADAVTVDTGFLVNYNVTTTGINRIGATSSSRYALVSGNAATGGSADYAPAFSVFEVDGAALLDQFRTASGLPAGALDSIDSLSFATADVSGALGGNLTPTAGSFVFSFADADVALADATVSPTYDVAQVGGLSTQLGPILSLGTGSYTPQALNTPIGPYALAGDAAEMAIVNAINAGENFHIVVTAGTPTTSAAIGGYAGLSPFLSPSTLSIDATVVPEPASLGLLALGGIACLRRRR